MRTIGYARVSTKEQAVNSQALEQQVARIVAAGVAEEDVLIDIERGSKDDRANFMKMMELVRAKRVDKVVLTRLDRFGRKTARTLDWIDEFNTHKVRLKFIDQNIDTTTYEGKQQLQWLTAQAANESLMLGQRVSMGWEYTRKMAKAIKPPFGYLVENEKYYLANRSISDPDSNNFENCDDFLCLIDSKQTLTKADLAKDVVETFIASRGVMATLRAINTKYGIQKFNRDEAGGNLLKHGFHFSKSGLTDWLHNPVLQGHTCYLRRKERVTQSQEKWDVKPDTHPDQAIISPEQYGEIQSILTANKMHLSTDPTKRKSAISGLVYCANCRAKMHSVCGKKRKTGESPRYFQCSNYRERACENQKLIRGEKIEEAILKALVYRQIDVQDGIDAINKEIASRPEVQDKITELREQLAVLSAMKRNPAIDRAKADIENQIKILELKHEHKKVSAQSANNYLNSPAIQQAVEQGNLFDNANITNLHKLIEAVWVRDGEVDFVEFN